MNLRDFFNISKESIFSNKLRSFLTSLSIIIGVFCIIILSSLGNAAKIRVLSSVEKIGSNLIFVMAGRSNSVAQFGRSNISLDRDTYEEINRLNHIEQTVPQIGTSSTVSYRNKEINTFIYGVNENVLSVKDYSIKHGRMFTAYDNESLNNVCILGFSVFRDLYSGEDILEKNIYMGPNRTPMRVIGILNEKGQNFAVDQDDRIYIPLDYYQKRIFHTDEITVIYIKAENDLAIGSITEKIKDILDKRYKNQADNFTVRTQGELLSTLSFISNTFTVLILLIALISLIVGGIGIMNIMLISVNERMQEIGIRKSVGAKAKEIEIQFLMEAAILSCAGAIAGIILSFMVQTILALIMKWDFYFPFGIMIASLIVSVSIGLVFGYFPAKKAAAVSPAETLRQL